MKEIIIEAPDRFGQELKPEKVNSEIKGELVRCKDCKRKDTLSCPKAPKRPDDWFCADGERRDDDA